MRRTKSNCLCIIWTSTWYLAYCNPSSGCTKSGPPPPLTIVVLCLNVHVGPSSTNHHVRWMHRERPFVHRGGNQICILFHCLDGPVNRRIPVKEQDNTDRGLSGCWTSEETHSPPLCSPSCPPTPLITNIKGRGPAYDAQCAEAMKSFVGKSFSSLECDFATIASLTPKWRTGGAHNKFCGRSAVEQ